MGNNQQTSPQLHPINNSHFEGQPSIYTAAAHYMPWQLIPWRRFSTQRTPQMLWTESESLCRSKHPTLGVVCVHETLTKPRKSVQVRVRWMRWWTAKERANRSSNWQAQPCQEGHPPWKTVCTSLTKPAEAVEMGDEPREHKDSVLDIVSQWKATHSNIPNGREGRDRQLCANALPMPDNGRPVQRKWIDPAGVGGGCPKFF